MIKIIDILFHTNCPGRSSRLHILFVMIPVSLMAPGYIVEGTRPSIIGVQRRKNVSRLRRKSGSHMLGKMGE